MSKKCTIIIRTSSTLLGLFVFWCIIPKEKQKENNEKQRRIKKMKKMSKTERK